VPIFEDSAPTVTAPVVLRPAAGGTPARRASTKTSFPRLPDIQEPEERTEPEARIETEARIEPEARIAAASASQAGALTRPVPRPGRTRAIAGWYVFLVVLVMASFSVTNLAVNHDTNLSLYSGAAAGFGLVMVVILLVSGQ
jgi:hypothetical protein